MKRKYIVLHRIPHGFAEGVIDRTYIIDAEDAARACQCAREGDGFTVKSPIEEFFALKLAK